MDEAVHGFYIGYKYQQMLKNPEITEARKRQLRDLAYASLIEIFENEVEYAKSLYDELGLTDQVIKFMELNANRALGNLGYEPLFDTQAGDVNPLVLKGLSTGVNHDFFSLAGSSYTMLNTGPVSESVRNDLRKHFNL